MYKYKARVSRVVDGDTLDLTIDLGFRTFVKQRVRLYGIDTPEIHGVKRDSEEYQKGKEAQAAVINWLDDVAPIDVGDPQGKWEVFLLSYDGKPLGQGKYGRWLAVIHAPSANPEMEQCLNDFLVAEGHAAIKTYR
jgi:micrococcal nuclease